MKALPLSPINGCALVELGQKNTHFSTVEGKYDTRTSGIVLKVDPANKHFEFLLGTTVYFEEFKEGSRISRDGKLYSFIKIEDIRGYDEQIDD